MDIGTTPNQHARLHATAVDSAVTLGRSALAARAAWFCLKTTLQVVFPDSDDSDDESWVTMPLPLTPIGAPHTKPKKKNGKMVNVITTQLLQDGTLIGGCFGNCKNQKVDIGRFAPNGDSHITNGKRQDFDAAVAAFAVAWRAGDEAEMQTQRARIERLRGAMCERCAASMSKLSKAVQACKDEWDRMRWEKCKEQDGCANPKCAERGMTSWIALQADHGENAKMRNAKDKGVNLSNYKYWAYHGGVDAMRKEALQIAKWICGVCHALEPTSTQSNEHDPAKMTKRKGDSDESFRKRKCHAKITFPKYDYINENYKRGRTCEYEGCKIMCVEGNEPGFHLDHIVEGTKRRCRCLNALGKHKGPCHGCPDKLFRRTGGVAGLANNGAKASALEHTKPLLDTEAVKCALLCIPCHLSRKAQKRARWDATPPAAVSGSVATTDAPSDEII